MGREQSPSGEKAEVLDQSDEWSGKDYGEIIVSLRDKHGLRYQEIVPMLPLTQGQVEKLYNEWANHYHDLLNINGDND